MDDRRVLVVDDDASVRWVLRRHLERDGFAVSEAADAAGATAEARALHPEVILLDLNMPGVSGYEALMALKADPATAPIPVLIVTGDTSAAVATECLRGGAHDFIRKPFEPIELVARVRAAQRHYAYESELRRRNRDLDHFAAHVAHDLKSPLAGIARLAEVLARLEPGAAARATFEEHLVALADDAGRMVADLLALARDDWAAAAVVHPVDTEALVRDVIGEAHLADADVTVAGEWGKPLIPEVVLRSALANLVSNADRYGRGADGRLHLEVTGVVDGGRCSVRVADTGPGIAADVAGRLFEPLPPGAAPDPRRVESSGMGLPVVARTLRRYGGDLEVLPAPRGAALVVHLPSA